MGACALILVLVLGILGVGLLVSRRGPKVRVWPGEVAYDSVEILHLTLVKSTSTKGCDLSFNSAFTRTRGRLQRGMSSWTITSWDGATTLRFMLARPNSRLAREFKTVWGSVWIFFLMDDSSDLPAVLAMLKVSSLDAWFQELQELELENQADELWEEPVLPTSP